MVTSWKSKILTSNFLGAGFLHLKLMTNCIYWSLRKWRFERMWCVFWWLWRCCFMMWSHYFSSMSSTLASARAHDTAQNSPPKHEIRIPKGHHTPIHLLAQGQVFIDKPAEKQEKIPKTSYRVAVAWVLFLLPNTIFWKGAGIYQ